MARYLVIRAYSCNLHMTLPSPNMQERWTTLTRLTWPLRGLPFMTSALEGGRGGGPKKQTKGMRLQHSVCDKGGGGQRIQKVCGHHIWKPTLRLRPTPVPVRLVNKSELSACAKLIGIFLYYRSPQNSQRHCKMQARLSFEVSMSLFRQNFINIDI